MRATLYTFFCVSVLMTLSIPPCHGQSLCATVKMEIGQDMTLERQGFDAHMRIANGFEHVALTNVNIAIEFTDEDGVSVTASSNPDDTNALFFISISSMSNINDVSGNGSIAPSTTADIHWLIIPAAGAGSQNPQGAVCYVGATLTYGIGDTQYETQVIPDYIHVKPLPDLALDYFLPGEVYADDAFTTQTEPSVPFSLGIRVENIGYGPAQNLRLDAGQPEIVDNVTGLLIGFIIESAEINGRQSSKNLLVDLGDIEPGRAGLGRWVMTCSLSGTFTNFIASFSHADELGGQLTSLIGKENIATHTLIHDVLDDTAGSDSIRDFLAADGTVYESDGNDRPATNLSAIANLTGSGGLHTLSVPHITLDSIYVKLSNPAGEGMALKEVVRSDGRNLSKHNFWISQSRNDANGWDYFFNLFDINASNYTYSVVYESKAALNDAPVLGHIGTKTGATNQFLGFVVMASDPDGTTPILSAASLPAGASLTDNADGTCSFGWTPTQDQVGEYRIKITAFDGELADSETITVTITDAVSGPWPRWWIARGVFDYVTSGTNDYAAVNQGQVKHIASMAWDELNTLPGGAGFLLGFTNADNYAAVNIGQLKNLAKPFHDRLGMKYPWENASETNDYAIANIGQVKNVFGFDPKKDSDGDGMPDWWENKYSVAPAFLDPNDIADASGDADADTFSNLYEYLHNMNPTAAD